MSGIAGVFNLDGHPADPAIIAKMTGTVAHRGPDGSGVWWEGPIGIGHRMLWTTTESLRERLPLVKRGGDLVLTADARIDNRDELLAPLGFSGRPSTEIADSELILAAYEKWGDRCPERLLGDFAFAIWDARKQTLFCARDHFGAKPLVYCYRPGKVFGVGSEIKSLLCLPDLPRRLNELRVGHHLAQTPYDKTLTFYEDVFRLPPAHCMTVTRGEKRQWSYWSLDQYGDLHLESDEEYAEAFREIFTEAVRCRLRSAFPIGSSLSGGLDSSAVTCVARNLMAQDGRLPLTTVSMVYDEVTECDERPFINAVLDQGGLNPCYTHPDQVSPLRDMDRVFWHEDETYGSPTLYLMWELCRSAASQGVRILLDGLDGDTAVSHGDEFLVDLGRTGRWQEFAAESRALSRLQNIPDSTLVLQRYGLPALAELARRGKWVSFSRGVNELSRLYDLSPWQLLWDQGIKPLSPQRVRRAWRAFHGRIGTHQLADRIVKRQFAQRIGLDESTATLKRHRMTPPRTAREEHYGNVTSGLIPYIFEMTDRAAAAFSLEARHPFYDKRVVEFCLALPPDQKLRHGWNRSIMRRALADILPAEVQWRGSKTLNSAAFTHSFLGFEGRLIDEVITKGTEAIAEYVDVPTLQAAYQHYVSHKSRADEMRVWVAVTLALWLDHTGLTP